MATSDATAGMAHPTVVPENFDAVEGEDDADGFASGDGPDTTIIGDATDHDA